jgi:hypothetical protein
MDSPEIFRVKHSLPKAQPDQRGVGMVRLMWLTIAATVVFYVLSLFSEARAVSAFQQQVLSANRLEILVVGLLLALGFGVTGLAARLRD